ncbi:putative F-box/FBD/LRR-repeat protein At2g05300 isoform X5 [Ipomoea triloba]|uniref:putative F-box/FBD/LRR-repeat protein At2g05300 isoform X5 n=1 Tax=Ipomoea triloba TaxID=35885 RepID=UPI00125D304C|nr:putative F-box/FBD/LRR-repeat protein At2g05300 isoform X5 [Ipomoea triloba]
MAQRRRIKTVSDGSRDLISELPGDVKDRILECLPTEDAARMTVLSTHWNDTWLQHGRLAFDSDFLHTLEQCYESYDDDDEGINKFEIISPPKLEILSVIHSIGGVVESRWLTPHLKAIKTLWLCGASLRYMDVSMFPTAINLQVMKLYELSFGCGKQLTVAMQLLQKCPNLCELGIMVEEESDSWGDDKEVASKLLEDPDGCFVIQELKMLNTIKIESFRESALIMLFMKMLLSKSPTLERVVILKHWDMNVFEMSKILRKLECFPRASPNAQIVCMGNYWFSYYERQEYLDLYPWF